MRIWRKRILRWLVTLVVLAAVALGTYSYLYNKVSDRVRSEVLRIADDMTTSSEDRDVLHRLLAEAHDQAFERALDLTKERGRQFDGEQYFNEVLDRVVAGARAEGLGALADSVDRQRQHFTFKVSTQ